MPLSDTDIIDWADDYTGADTNTPTDTQLINGQLDDEVRNIKSVVRAESRAKQWERCALTPTYVNETAFTLPGDVRDTAIIGRRIKATVNSRVVYAYISNSTYSAPNTTVALKPDKVYFSDATLTVLNTDTIYFTGNFNTAAYFRGGTHNVELWNAAGDRAPARWTTTNCSFNGTATLLSCSFPGASVPVDFTTFLPTKMFWEGNPIGLNSDLTAISFGPYTPDTFQSGLPHRTLGGTFNVTGNSTVGPFTVNFPVNADTGASISLHTTSYHVQLQPTGVVSGTPNTTAWANAYVSAKNASNFNITLSAAINSGPVVQFDYYICLGN